MIFLKECLLGICGLSFGLLSSAGVFTVLASVGLVPRFAGKMHVANHVFVIEEAVILGTMAGGFFSLFGSYGEIGQMMLKYRLFGDETIVVLRTVGGFILIASGLFAGMFVGCLAFAIAEMLDSIPIFARRIGFRHGLGVAISAAAIGKLVGSLLYFAKEIYLTAL